MNVPGRKKDWASINRGRRTSRVRWLCPMRMTLLIGSLLLTTGCTRNFFRNWADREVATVLEEKNVFSAWQLREFNVYPNRLARYYDPTDPDHPPMPPDDPAAWLLSTHPQKPKDVARIDGTGYLDLLATWDTENRANLKHFKELSNKAMAALQTSIGAPMTGRKLEVSPVPGLPIAGQVGLGQPQVAKLERPVGKTAVVQTSFQQPAPDGLPRPPKADAAKVVEKAAAPEVDDKSRSRPCPTALCPEQPYLINLEQSVELGVLNSREYQDRREELYVSALPVTFERFSFLPQFLLNQDLLRNWAGSQSTSGARNDASVNTTAGMTQQFFTGALLSLQLVNRTAWNLTGNQNHTQSVTNLSLDLAQPLLRGGGRAVALEGLTQSERNLVYSLRNYARFQRAFFVSIVSGANVDVDLTVGGRTITAGITSSNTPVGYLQTLLRQEQLTNDVRNEEQLIELGERYKNLAKGGTLSKLQVDQIEQQRLQARSQVLVDEVQYGDALDQFKIQLGIPTNACLELDRSPLQPLRSKLDELDDVYSSYRKLLDDLDQQTNRAATTAEIRGLIRKAMEDSYVARTTRAGQDLKRRWINWRGRSLRNGQGVQEVADAAALMSAAPALGLLPLPFPTASARLTAFDASVRAAAERTEAAQNKIAEYTKDDKPVPPELERELAEATVEQEVAEMEYALQILESRPWDSETSTEERRRAIDQAFRMVRNKFALVIENARIERLQAIFGKWPELPAIRLQGKDLLTETPENAQDLAERVALANRLDLMNERAILVDTWRQIAIDANGLLGVVNLNYHVDVTSTLPSVPGRVTLTGSQSAQDFSVHTELPLVRINERNVYRATLIAYQRQRRSLMLEEDRVLFQIRQDLRQLRQFKANYDVQKLSVELAYQQIDNALETLQAPPDPGVQRDAATAAAALTQQIINAQSSLPRAQNALFSAWVNYVTTRMRLYRDLELLRVDARGVWIDEFASPEPAVQRPFETPQ